MEGMHTSVIMEKNIVKVNKVLKNSIFSSTTIVTCVLNPKYIHTPRLK
jgi:hypothetical protein